MKKVIRKTTKAQIKAKAAEVAKQEFVQPKPVQVVITPPAKDRTRLRVGDVCDIFRQRMISVMVNDCRALFAPARAESLDVKEDGQFSFSGFTTGESISPNSDIPILARLGLSGAVQYLGRNGNEEPTKGINGMSKNEISQDSVLTAAFKRLGVKGVPQSIVPVKGSPYIAVCWNQKDGGNFAVRCTSDYAAVTAAGQKDPKGTWTVRGHFLDSSMKFDVDDVLVASKPSIAKTSKGREAALKAWVTIRAKRAAAAAAALAAMEARNKSAKAEKPAAKPETKPAPKGKGKSNKK